MLFHKLPPFQNVGANLPTVLPVLPLGMTYHGIILKRGGTTFTNAHLSNIRIKLEGKQFFDATGPHLRKMCDYNSIGALNWLFQHLHVENTAGAYAQNANTAGLTPYAGPFDYIPFADPMARTIGGESMGAIDTSVGYTQFGMEIDIGGATNPTLEGWAVLSPPKAANDPNRFTIGAMLKATHAYNAAGEFSLPVPLGSKAGALIHRLYFMHANATKLQVSKDGLWLAQEGEEALLDYYQGLIFRQNQSGMIVYDPSINDNQSDSVSTIRKDNSPATFDFKLTLSAGDTVQSYSSLYSTIDRL